MVFSPKRASPCLAHRLESHYPVHLPPVQGSATWPYFGLHRTDSAVIDELGNEFADAETYFLTCPRRRDEEAAPGGLQQMTDAQRDWSP